MPILIPMAGGDGEKFRPTVYVQTDQPDPVSGGIWVKSSTSYNLSTVMAEQGTLSTTMAGGGVSLLVNTEEQATNVPILLFSTDTSNNIHYEICLSCHSAKSYYPATGNAMTVPIYVCSIETSEWVLIANS